MQFAPANAKSKIAKEYVFSNAISRTKIKYENTTMYKNNSGLIAKTKASKYNKDLCLTEKFAFQNPLLFLYKPLVVID